MTRPETSAPTDVAEGASRRSGGRHLVIVESPAKAKTINKILGSDYVVKASMGHVQDLPIKKFGVDIRRGFKPQYVTVKGRERVIHDLARAAKAARLVFLAPDPDREGEAIAWHLQQTLAESAGADKFRRVFYNEITARAVRRAFETPTEIDMKRVDAQQARRVLDRIVGYKVSPLLWSRVKGGLSAGRVQSVALRLVCEREDEIRHFVPRAYWVMGAVARKKVEPRDPFRLRLARIDDKPAEINSPEQSEGILDDLDDRPLRVLRVVRKEVSKRAFPPFITSTLQQSASNAFGFSPERTMRIAQVLYEGVDLGEGPVGLITYMRTDSFSVARDAQEACRRLIAEKYGAEFLPDQPNVYRSRRGAQEAHEAIRPTDVNLSPDRLEGRLSAEEQKLYGLIWRRFVASQMAPARIERRTAEVEAVAPAADKAQYLFRATASQLMFPGYMKVLGIPPDLAREKSKPDEDKDEEAEEEVDRLPPLSEGEFLDRIEWLSERKETQPPPRYSEASLIRVLEENGVGRPSTYAQILSTLQKRKYVKVEKKSVVPTELGMTVSQILVTNLGALFDVTFTAEMEKQLDEIEEGRVQGTQMLSEFYTRFKGWMTAAKGPPADAGKVQRLLTLLRGVREWAPEVRDGKRVRNDRAFVESLEKRAATGGGLSERQLEALARIGLRYESQVPGIKQALSEMNLAHVAVAAPPSAATRQKLKLLENVRCDEPAERHGKKYDDRAFINSLQSQVTDGRGLSPAQVRALDRLVVKYHGQIPDYERERATLGLHHPEPPPAAEIEALLTELGKVTEWDPPRQRGHRTFDDRAFYQSLLEQFGRKKTLSFKQVAALQKLSRRYSQRHAGPAHAADTARPEAAKPLT